MTDTELTQSQIEALGTLFMFPTKQLHSSRVLDVMTLMNKGYVHILFEEFHCTKQGVNYLANHQLDREMKITPAQLKEVVEIAFDAGELWGDRVAMGSTLPEEHDILAVKAEALKQVIDKLCTYWAK